MKATDLLKEQHEDIRSLFEQLEEGSKRQQLKIFEELATNLLAHDVIEREIFYPACKSAPGVGDLLGESLAEHSMMHFGLYQADQANGADGFKQKCSVLRETVLHHLEEEERELFPKVEKKIGTKRLEALSEQLMTRFEQAKEEDFRAALQQNLKEEMGGLMRGSNGGRAMRAKSSNGRTGKKPSRTQSRKRSL